MDPMTWLILLVLAVIAVTVLYFMKNVKKEQTMSNNNPTQSTPPLNKPLNPEALRIKLQAYERLTILCDRIGLSNLVSRYSPTGLTAKQLQATLTEAIKTEYEYNVSQQIYVSPQIWEAISNLKDQNIFIINQLLTTLPPDATALELSKAILQFLEADTNASLQSIVMQAISHEAKQLMQ